MRYDKIKWFVSKKEKGLFVLYFGMSNPAVVKLQRKKIANTNVWLDDNFGESIHLHMDKERVDFTNEEFDAFCSDINEVINSMIDVDEFDIRKIDPTFFETMLNGSLLKLKQMKIDKIKLSELKTGRKKACYLPESECVKALNGDKSSDNSRSRSDHINQTREERLSGVMNHVKEHGYPYNGEYIILSGDDNMILDGMHRAACLYKLNGDMEVPVLRVYIDGYQGGIQSNRLNYLKIYLDEVRKNPRKLIFDIEKSLIKTIRNTLSLKQKIKYKKYRILNKKSIENANETFRYR